MREILGGGKKVLREVSRCHLAANTNYTDGGLKDYTSVYNFYKHRFVFRQLCQIFV